MSDRGTRHVTAISLLRKTYFDEHSRELLRFESRAGHGA